MCSNAGVGTMGPVHKPYWRTGTWSSVSTSWASHRIRSFLPRLLEQDEGHIVNTSSNQGLTTGPGWGPHGASKHAVVALTECWRQRCRLAARDWAPRCSAPGRCAPPS